MNTQYYFASKRATTKGRFKPSQHVPTCCVRLSTMYNTCQRFYILILGNIFYLYMVFCRDKANAGSLLNLINEIKEMLANVGQHF